MVRRRVHKYIMWLEKFRDSTSYKLTYLILQFDKKFDNHSLFNNSHIFSVWSSNFLSSLCFWFVIFLVLFTFYFCGIKNASIFNSLRLWVKWKQICTVSDFPTTRSNQIQIPKSERGNANLINLKWTLNHNLLHPTSLSIAAFEATVSFQTTQVNNSVMMILNLHLLIQLTTMTKLLLLATIINGHWTLLEKMRILILRFECDIFLL